MTKQIKVGNVFLGGGSPVRIQSMLNTDSRNTNACIEQAKALENIGCEIIRLAIPDMESLNTIYALKNSISIPVVADIHFNYRLAIESVNAGADKIRINPGNIGDDSRVKAVVEVCKQKNIPIRVGVNSGSLEKSVLSKYNGVTAPALAESALYSASLVERFNYNNIVLSVKSADVKDTVEANRLLSEQSDYPLHIGVTEAGTVGTGIVKSSIGIGSLLLDGIGDTIRVSLTADPKEEIYAAKKILRSLGLSGGVNVVACPTCGRTQVDVIGLANQVENALSASAKNITVAVMGCAVNGPGEAKNADIGVAGGNGRWSLIKKGEVVRGIEPENVLNELLKEIESM